MSVHFNLKRLRPNLDGLGFLIDVGMILLVIANLSLILFDWIYRVEAVQSAMETYTPDFYRFYSDSIHANFFEIDLAFVSVYLTEFVIRWAAAIARQTYHRWFFYPFVHWYDLLGCIPVGSFRWLRILRVVSLMYRLQKLGVVDFRDTAVGAAVIAFARGHLRSIAEWRAALVEATRTTATLFIVIFGALVFAQFINLSGLPYDLVDIVDDFNDCPKHSPLS